MLFYKHIQIYVIQLTPLGGFSHQVPNPPCQLSLWEELNRRTRRKPTTFGRVLTNSSQVRSEIRYRTRTHDLSGGRTSLRPESLLTPRVVHHYHIHHRLDCNRKFITYYTYRYQPATNHTWSSAKNFYHFLENWKNEKSIRWTTPCSSIILRLLSSIRVQQRPQASVHNISVLEIGETGVKTLERELKSCLTGLKSRAFICRLPDLFQFCLNRWNNTHVLFKFQL